MMRETTRDRWHGAKCRNIPGPAWDELAEAAIAEGNGLATDLCHDCPVQQDCLEEALRHERLQPARNRWSIWGGLTPEQRVTEALRREDLPPRRGAKVSERRTRVAELAAQGMGGAQISRELDEPPRTIHSDLEALSEALTC